MTKFTKEQLTRIIDSAEEVITALEGTNDDVHPDDSKKMCAEWDYLNDNAAPPEVVREMARQLLASMEQEPVGYYREATDGDGYYLASTKGPRPGTIPLYAAPQLPQPAVVIPLGVTWEDVPEEITEDDMGLASAWAHGFNQCRAAMLQGAEPVSQHCAIPANSFSNKELEGMAHGDNPQANAYRELLAYRLSADGWIPCSERMPDTMISVLVTGDWFHHAVSFWDGASWCDLDFEPPVTHWMPLPVAPQQEV